MVDTVEALVDGGRASAGPPLGPALGPKGVNIGQVIAKINEKTKAFEGMKVPVKVLINDDKNYFYAAYDSTSNSYTFTGLQNYIMNIFEYDPNHILNPDDSLNPSADYSNDSDKIQVPITDSKTTSSYTTDTSIVPYLGGLTYANIDNENIRIQVVYSTKIY